MAAYSLMALNNSDPMQYNILYTARVLREAQQKMLSSCGMDPPNYLNIEQEQVQVVGRDNRNRFEPLVDRPPSQSVIVVERRPMRRLLNAQDILSTCRDLKLECSLFDANEYFSPKNQGESDNFCDVLKQFQGIPLVVGVQGAEMFYPIFLALRVFLVTPTYDPNMSTDARRIGNVTGPGETQAAPNLVSGGTLQFDRYFPEFGMIFGSDLTPIQSKVDIESGKFWRNSTKQQCKNQNNYCADLTANINNVRTNLEQLIKEGKLLQAK
jgi:hypothetical protein